ncbi:uncharacterized protein LOC125664802 [Ostrea edulis]|uniref:uncharacterized protein LOC125664802 n=1 Tax=Ostrea edulis TaxID=37623 RepID=UPI0024AFA2E4|nr:uncharacterized protein LOC125664802 [Ostrea edulis]
MTEQSLELQTLVYSVFNEFHKAFENVNRDVIWRLVQYHGFPPKFITIIQQLYEDATCQVIHDRKLTEAFSIHTGVRQGWPLSPMILLLTVTWIMRQAAVSTTGIQWIFTNQLEDVNVADDNSVLFHKMHKRRYVVL